MTQYIPIRHDWVETKNPFRGASRVNIDAYYRDEGNEHSESNLIEAIRHMLPGHISQDNYYQPESYKFTSNQITILLPFANEFDGDNFASDNKGWDFYNFDNLATKNFLSSDDGAIGFLTCLQLLGLNEPAINNLIAQADLIEDISPFTKYRKAVLKQIAIIESTPHENHTNFLNLIKAPLWQLRKLPVSRDVEFYKDIHESLLVHSKSYPKELGQFRAVVESEFKRQEHLTDLGLNTTKPFIKCSELFDKDKMPGFIASLNQNENNFLIPRLKGKDGIFNDFSYVCSLKVQDSEEETLKQDLKSIRKELSYLMSHSSGIAITLNIPFKNDGMRNKKMATPTVFMPDVWSSTINSLRASTTKVKLEKDDPILAGSKEEIREILQELAQLFGLVDSEGKTVKVDLIKSPLPSKNLVSSEKKPKHSEAKKRSTELKKKKKDVLAKVSKRILTYDGKTKYEKGSVPVRMFPDPK